MKLYYCGWIAIFCLIGAFLSVNPVFASKGLNINSAETTGLGIKHKPRIEQPPAPPKIPKRFQKRISWEKKLSLTPMQIQQLQKIYDDSQPSIEELQQQIYQAHKKIDEIYQEENQKIRDILTEKQQQKFDKELVRYKRNRGEKITKPKKTRPMMPQF